MLIVSPPSPGVVAPSGRHAGTGGDATQPWSSSRATHKLQNGLLGCDWAQVASPEASAQWGANCGLEPGSTLHAAANAIPTASPAATRDAPSIQAIIAAWSIPPGDDGAGGSRLEGGMQHAGGDCPTPGTHRMCTGIHRGIHGGLGGQCPRRRQGLGPQIRTDYGQTTHNYERFTNSRGRGLVPLLRWLSRLPVQSPRPTPPGRPHRRRPCRSWMRAVRSPRCSPSRS